MAGNRRLATLILVGWVALRAAAAVAAEGGTGAAGGPIVSSLSFQVASPYQLTYEELYGLVALRPGDPLTAEAVRDSIRRLYTKSVFREVTAYVREEGGNVALLFFLRPTPFVSEIEVKGLKALPASLVVAVTRIRRGSLLGEKDLATAEDAVRALLSRKGFTAGKVAIEVSCNTLNGSGKVRINVDEGNPAVVESLEVPGAGFFPRDDIERILGVEIGKRHDFSRWEEGIIRLRKEYRQAGFLTVHVEESASSCGESGGLCLRAVVEEGRRYDIRWEGVREFTPDRLAKAAGLQDTEETTEGALLYDLRERVLAFYREKGYLLAQVDVATGEEKGGKVPLTVTVREGKAGYVKKIGFEGNQGIPGQTLRRQIATRERGVFHWFTGSGKYSDEEWSQDLSAIVGYYQKEGYARMKIAGVDNVWDEKGGIAKTIRIEEGDRYRLREILFRGNDHFLRAEILKWMRNREGKFVDYVGLERDQEAIVTGYRDSGFLDATVEGKLDFDGGKDTVVASFDIAEGPRYRLGSVVVVGNLLTRATVVLRENPIASGGTAGEKDLLKFQQSVYGTGLYKSVRLQRVKRPAEGILDLVVEVEEAMFFEVEFGGGYGTETGVRGSVLVKEKNIDGFGRSLSGFVMIGQKEQKYTGELREPYVFGNRWKWEGALTASHQFAERPSFSFTQTALVTAISQKFLERSTVSFQYEFSRDDTFDVQPGAVLSPEDQGSANIAGVRGLVVLDFRDDPFNPKRGVFGSGGAELATELLGSQVDYWSLTGQGSYYLPFVRRNSLAFSARAGVILPYGGTQEVPIQKRFFAGGRTTVRGFAQDSLGPHGADGTATGGNYQLILNAEVRVPLQYGFLSAAFVDAGSVWLSRDPLVGFDLRETAGVSLRYITPVGPISLDYGWKLDRRPGESSGEWHFTIGAVF